MSNYHGWEVGPLSVTPGSLTIPAARGYTVIKQSHRNIVRWDRGSSFTERKKKSGQTIRTNTNSISLMLTQAHTISKILPPTICPTNAN